VWVPGALEGAALVDPVLPGGGAVGSRGAGVIALVWISLGMGGASAVFFVVYAVHHLGWMAGFEACSEIHRNRRSDQ
jgi:hypothetical protein